MQKARGHGTRPLPPLVGTRFQVLFHSPSGVLFTFPSRYLSAIGHQGVLSLRGWSPQIQSAFHGCGLTQERLRKAVRFRLRDDCPLWCAVPHASTITRLCNFRRIGHDPGRRPTTPDAQRVTTYTRRVWADPFSLATTQEVSVVSLPWGSWDVFLPLPVFAAP